MTHPVRVQLSRRKGWRMPENTVKVDRSTPLGNPFVVGIDGTREHCVYLYRALLSGLVCVTCKASPTDQIAARKYFFDHVNETRDKNRGCWCSLPRPGEPDICHAAVQIEAAKTCIPAPEERKA